MDLAVLYNQRMRKIGKENLVMTNDDLAGNFELFQFAATDTSFQTTSGSIVLLAENPEKQEELAKSLENFPGPNDTINCDILDSFEYLDWVAKEGLRLMGPFIAITPRVATKNFTICGKKIFKGDRILVGAGVNQFSGAHVKDPEVYEPERFAPERKKQIKKLAYIPFSSGKRICVGQYLGEMFVKLIIGCFAKEFEIKAKSGQIYKRDMCMLYGISNADVLIRPRRR